MYINSGNLASDIMEEGLPLFEHISFYSYDITMSTLLILLTGKGPEDAGNQSGNLHRNMINSQYYAALIVPLMKDKFSRVKNVKSLLSGDPRFNDAVIAKGEV